MLKCFGISKHYVVENKIIMALDNVDLCIGEGEFVAVMGQSGSGKSTLMNILGCLDTPSAGEYYLGNNKVSELNRSKLSKLRSVDIGFVFQSFNLLANLNAFENVRLPLLYKRISAAESRALAQKALNAVGMSERARHLPSQLSGGQQQRVSVARAIVTDPRIILADEPTGNLDEENTADVLNLLLNQSRKGKTVVLVTHDPKIAKKADRIVKIVKGKLTN